MYYTYILHSEKLNRYYIGYSSDPKKRLEERHNCGLVKSTKAGIPYCLMAMKSFETEKEAMNEERRLKKMKSRKYLEWLLDAKW